MKQSRHAVALGRGEFPFLVSQFVAGSGEITPSFAAFIDTLTSFWQLECRIRREAIWSPMPWSAESQREGRPEWSIRECITLTLLGLGNEHLDDDHWVFHLLGCNWGRVLNIPWLSGSHDGFPFCYTLSSYTRIRRDDTSILRCSDLAIWLSAMTFGLLEIISGIKIPETQLLRVDAAGGVVISGALILRFLFGWSFFVAKKRTEHAAGPEQRLRHSSDVVQNLHRALESLYECMLDHKLVFRAGLPEKQVEDIICSLGMFLSVLCLCVATIWEDVPECVALGDIDAMQHRYIISTSLLSRKRMLSAGWCPYTISIPFIQGTPIPVLSNIIHLDPFVRDDPQEHQHCTGNSCKFYTIDIPSYVPRHADDACSCSSVKPLLQGVTDLLAEDTIPVVVFDGAQLVVKRSSEVPYVAISHVWADGLGSTTEDGLPSCQIARVSRLARQLLPASGAFWMDSLCVPALHDLRKRAIKLMAKTYADADKVVVLDVGIRARCARANSWEENVLRIATSGWVTRVWTLQEGLLARQLYFEVADGIIESEELESFDGPTRSRMAQQFTRGVLPILEYRYKRKQSSTFQCTLRDVIRLLRRRTTTKPEDESIAIAGILPLDVRALLNIVGPNAAEMRMKAALLQLRHVPRRFPLLPQEKLALPGFKWAPCNLASALESDDVDGDAVCTEDGLLSRYTLVPFDTAVPTTTSSITANATQFTFILSHPSSGALHLVRIPSHVPFDTATISSIHALIMTDDTLPAVQGQGSYCALVSMDAQPASAGKTEDVPLVLRYITPGEVLLLPFPRCEEDLVQVGVVDNSYIRLV
ncbi:hypothetical protein PYCCODRAFT_1363918 [Trametes coccinea BRFM310]|uniref:Heterokaryon incompatibility domain-containing protein n=1 Tax=Trametes coccinea (strain BRFM310) TaxID=1353009 RepID=A0A1Y2IU11_TRAC3|nr:hypothetical protein PYCCODRAFT_1363918 [Trametes coccinea BRFM310]